MSRRTVSNVFTLVVMSVAAALFAADGVDAPQGVSPGSWDRVVVVGADCPTFSWEVVPDTSHYELVAYRLPESFNVEDGLDLGSATQVLYTRIPGGAASWTPDASDRFAPGGSYAWFVRAVIDPESGDATGWSAPRLFTVPRAPSLEEVRDALGVLERYVAENPGAARQLATFLSKDRRAVPPAPTARPRPATASPKATFTGESAIKAVQPDATGETYGVYGVTSSETDGSLGLVGEATAATGEVFGVAGVTASPEGAGVVAFNAADGPDLLLADESYSAYLTEAGLDRPYPGAAVFEFTNSDGAGSMTLQVDGVDVVTTLTDLDTLGGLSCATGELAAWDGSQWSCAEDVDTDTLAGLGCVHDQIAKWNSVLGAWECSDDADTDTDTLGGMACVADQIPKWSGTFWYCSLDADTTYSNGNQLGLAGTTFNVLEGPGSGLDADTLDSHDTNYFAPAAHGHFGAVWSGAAADGLKVDNTSSGTSFAIKGWATATTGGTYGIFGKSTSTEGTGVWGWADAATGETYGVYGLSGSSDGHGVHGEATSPTGTTSGVYGASDSADGFGVYAENTAGGFDFMAGGSGDVGQTLDGDGLVKAAALVNCAPASEVLRYFNHLGGAADAPVWIERYPDGHCEIGFTNWLQNRFWSITRNMGAAPAIFCSLTTPSTFSCVGRNYDGSVLDFRAMIVIY